MAAPLTPGDKAPAFTLHTLDGSTRTLAELQRGGHSTLLIFLRHLG